MTKNIDRRKFISHMALGGSFLVWPGTSLISRINSSISWKEEEPLLDWSLWKKYRTQVQHPALTIKSQDLTRAKYNINSYEWAKNYTRNIKAQADHFIKAIHRHGLDRLIEKTTPGDPLWTPCPSCREKGLPVHPHGSWEWGINDPDKIVCEECHETFPHADYPEDIVLKTSWGTPQVFEYYGGEPFKIFGFTKGRPSFTANIRARKVQWCANACRTIAEAYFLHDNPVYAKECKAILCRFALCYPHWLVHVGYGEYADMDPRIAAQNIQNLPQPELTPPPNQPDRRLWTGYWSAGRASGVGFESDFVRKVVETYDLTCTAMDEQGRSIYSDEERVQIERDLLLESTILLVCDKSINNKSISNRTAVGLVGMCTGHPEMVRFALEGFDLVMHDWFLPDGTTKESPFYGLMTLGGIWDLAQSVRDYSDPEDYQDSAGERIDGLNLYEDPAFQRVWEAFYKGLQGDLSYPPFADSFHGITLDPSYVELMVANYPEKSHYLALLKEYCGDDLSRPTGPVPASYFDTDVDKVEMMTLIFPYDLARASSPSSFSLYYRKPGLANKQTLPVKFKDWNPENLRIGHMRTGKYGRESLLLLNASHWRGHNHRDSLDLYYWKNGQAILSDLGYLWDHPEEEMTSRTLAHNTVVIDQKDQISKNRGGEMFRFRSSQHVKMMEAESNAYQEAQLYRRTAAIIDHGDGRNYVVDFFRVQGGETQDYVFHLDTVDYGLSEPDSWDRHPPPLYDFDETQAKKRAGSWQIRWSPGGNMKAMGWMMEQTGEKSYIGTGWGQKDWENSDHGARATYVVRRGIGAGLKAFVSVYEGSDTGEFFVKDVQYEPEKDLLEITTAQGTDYVMCALDRDTAEITIGSRKNKYKGHFVVVSVRDHETQWEFVENA